MLYEMPELQRLVNKNQKGKKNIQTLLNAKNPEKKKQQYKEDLLQYVEQLVIKRRNRVREKKVNTVK